MIQTNDNSLIIRFKFFSKSSGLFAAFIGTVVLTGWAFDLALLKSVFPDSVTMKPNTALGFLLAGISLTLLHADLSQPKIRFSSQIFAGLVSLIGLLTLSEYVLNTDLAIDQIMFEEPMGSVETSHPGRMAPNTALNFLLIGLSLILTSWTNRAAWICQLPAIIVGFVGLIGLISFHYSSVELYGAISHTKMAIHTAITFGVLSAGILCLYPEKGLTAIAARNSPGGMVIRRLLPAFLILVLFLGELRLIGLRRGLFGVEFGLVFMVAAMIAVITILIWLLAIHLDRIDEKRIENYEECERFFKISLDMFCIADFKGYFRRISPSWEKMLGWNEQELLTKPYVDFIHPDDREKTGAEAQKISTGSTTFSFENRYRCKDGKYKWLLWNASPVIEQQLIYAVARDITERKQAEEKLLQDHDKLKMEISGKTQELQEVRSNLQTEVTERKSLEAQFLQSQKMEAIGRLAGGIAHDFNNLLTAISGYTNLLLEQCLGQDPMREDLEEIKKSADRAASLTRQLLAFSRKQIFSPKILSINNTLKEMEKMLKRVIGEDIDLTFHLDPSAGQVESDPSQIEQIIMNLVVNSRDSMPKGGKITIETSNFDLDKSYAETHLEANTGPYVMFSVSDTGQGMNEETKTHIFEPFFTTKEKGKGTGLGLSTVYGIVKQSGGNVWVYSELGQGTSFKIYLPRVHGVIERTEKIEKTIHSHFGSEVILLVEDEDVVRKLAQRILKQYGYRVLAASNGQQAFSMILNHKDRIDLLLTDTIMPRMDGRELAQKITDLYPSTKVIFMSGYTDTAIVEHGVLKSDVHFIEKPFAPEMLAQKVREVLDHDRQGLPNRSGRGK